MHCAGTIHTQWVTVHFKGQEQWKSSRQQASISTIQHITETGQCSRNQSGGNHNLVQEFHCRKISDIAGNASKQHQHQEGTLLGRMTDETEHTLKQSAGTRKGQENKEEKFWRGRTFWLDLTCRQSVKSCISTGSAVFNL